MRERWNHPCVVISDAQNESSTDETGKAIHAVRQLDLSGRPWENGWAGPQSTVDCVESHPYLFSRVWAGEKPFKLSMMPEISGVPYLNDRQKQPRVPIIINEYDWLWLKRDGTPTCLTDKVYETILGSDNTLEKQGIFRPGTSPRSRNSGAAIATPRAFSIFAAWDILARATSRVPREGRRAITGSISNSSPSNRPSRNTCGTLSTPWGSCWISGPRRCPPGPSKT